MKKLECVIGTYEYDTILDYFLLCLLKLVFMNRIIRYDKCNEMNCLHLMFPS